MADSLMFKKGLLANLPANKTSGTIYVTTDERAMYIDVDPNTRIRLGDFIEVATQADLAKYKPYSTTSLYYVEDVNALMKYKGVVDGYEQFVTLNSTKNVSDYIAAVEKKVDANTGAITKIQGDITTIKGDITNLGTDLTELEALVNANETDIEGKLAKEISDRKAADTALDGKISANAAAITAIKKDYALKTELQAETSAREAADTAINGTLTNHGERIEALEGTVGNSTSGLVKKVNDLSATVSNHTTNITALQNKDKTLEADIATNAEDIAALQGSVAENIEDIEGLAGRMTAAENTIINHGSRLTAVEGTVSTHTTNITALQNDMKKKADKTTVDALDAAYKAADAALGTRIDGVEADVAENAANIALNLGKINANKESIDAHAASITQLQNNKADKTALNKVESDYKAADEKLTNDLTALTGRVTTAEGEIDTLQTDLDAAEKTIGEHTGSITALQNNKLDKTTFNEYKTAADAADAKHTADIAALVTKTDKTNTDLGALTTRVTKAEGTISTHTGNITALQNKDKAIDAEISKIKGQIGDVPTTEGWNLYDYINDSFKAADAMTFKSHVTDFNTLLALPANQVNAGDTYVMSASSNGWAAGDLIIALQDGKNYSTAEPPEKIAEYWVHIPSGYSASTENKLNAINNSLVFKNYLGTVLNTIKLQGSAGVKVTAANDTVTVAMEWGSF